MECKERKKNLDGVVLEALAFTYSRPEFASFENHWYHVLSRVTNCSAETVGSSCCLRKGNSTKTVESLLL